MNRRLSLERFLFQRVRWWAWGIVLLLSLSGCVSARAANPMFLGNLALLADETVVQQLQLSLQQRQQVQQLLQQRDAAALELAIASRQLPPGERQQKLSEFVADSEQMTRELLSPAQQQSLRQLQYSREGLAAMSRADVAEALQLSAAQQQQIQAVLEERRQKLAELGEADADVERAVFEQRLQQLLSPDQQARWGQLSGRSSPATAPIAAADVRADIPAESAAAAAPPATDAARDVASSATESDPSGSGGTTPGPLQFNFRFAPWKDVLEWFAERADLSLVLEAPPPGTFNYSDSKTYTTPEAIDLLNSVLLTKGYTLVRRERMLLLVNLEDGIPPNLVTTVPVEQLDQRGEFELVSCVFPLGTSDAATVEQELTKLIGPQGSVQLLPQARQILVTETAGRLRTIRNVLRSMEDPTANGAALVRVMPLQHIQPEEAFQVVRQMLGLPEELNASPDGTLRMAADPSGRRIMVTGQPDAVSRVAEVVKLIDVPADGALPATPQLEVYSVLDADSDAVLQVLQTLLVDEPHVRLATDPQTGHLIALGLPSHHATIRATLEQLQKDAQQVEVLRLRFVDPQAAVLSINKLFGGGEEGSSKAPRVDADLNTNQLLVRGSANQIAQIRALLEKMGETGSNDDPAEQTNRKLRVVPLTGLQADAVLQQVQEIWPTLRANRIRTVTPSAAVRAIQPRRLNPHSPPASAEPSPAPRESTAPSEEAPPAPSTDRRVPPLWPPPTDPGAILKPLAESSLVMALSLVPPPTDSESNPPDRAAPGAARDSEPPAAQAPTASAAADGPSDGADIVVAPGPTGLVIASQDLEALNDFEELLLTLANRASGSSRQFAVFYLRHATAEVAAELLIQVLGGDRGDAAGDGAGGAGGLLGSLAGAALGDAGGGLVGSLLGLAGGGSPSSSSSGSFLIVPETRLNLLIVQANPNDIELIEQLLQMIDQRTSPEEVQTIAAPRLVPVLNTGAESVAEVVRQVYANRLASGPGQARQPTPEEFLRALRGGGRGGGGGESKASVQEQRQMTIGVDNRSNSLVVSAPDSLFEEVKVLVGQLDQAESGVMETSRVVTLRRANPQTVRQAIAAFVGQAAARSSPSAPAATPAAAAGSGGPPPTGGPPRGGDDAEGMRRRLEFFRALQQGVSAPGPPSGQNARPGRRSGAGR